MNLKERQAIRERVEKATSGEWKNDEQYIVAEVSWGRPGGEVIGDMNPTVQGPRPEYSRSERIANASFSAHAKQDIPDLLDELEEAIGMLSVAKSYIPQSTSLLEEIEAFLTSHE